MQKSANYYPVLCGPADKGGAGNGRGSGAFPPGSNTVVQFRQPEDQAVKRQFVKRPGVEPDHEHGLEHEAGMLVVLLENLDEAGVVELFALLDCIM